MSKNIQTAELSKPAEPLIKQSPFDFLPECLGTRFDFTSAGPLDPEESNIMPPKKVLATMNTINFKDFLEVNGVSRGEESTLNGCVNFFEKYKIVCGQEDVSLNNNILLALEHVYKKIGLNKDRKILVPTPTFGHYFKQFEENEIAFETLPLKAENNFLPTAQELEEAIIKSRAVALLLCYPNNPTGTVMTEECAAAIAEITEKHNIFVISDEAFMNNSLSENQHFPVAAIKRMLERSITITSPAKSMFIGAKTGFCVGRRDIIKSFAKLGGYPTKQAQRIMTAAIEGQHRKSRIFAAMPKLLLKQHSNNPREIARIKPKIFLSIR